MKRFFDFIISFLLLLILLVPIIIIAIFLRITIGSPVTFSQQRPGKDGKIFNIYKFRTMTDDVDENGNLLSDEERLTTVGKVLRKLSLDELPQLVNVLKGDMSFVGPRPLLVGYLPLYNEKQARRHKVRPGITGWAQVNGRNAVSWEERFELDVWYVDNQTLLLDLKILFMTIGKVLKSEGVSQEGHVTVEPFRGNKEGETD